MIKSLRKRFIAFSVLVISSIIIMIGLFVFAGSPSNLPARRYITTASLATAMVFVGSWLLSKAAIRPIQAAWHKQLDFTADASHELRTPIATIQTNLEVVMDSPAETVESQMKWLKNIEAENKRMARLVEDLLTLSRADTDQQALEIETFMLEEAVSQAIAPFEPAASMKNIALDVRVDKGISFRGDRKRFKQLIVILADNALNYTDSGTITVHVTRSEKELKLTVSDTGHGIEAEHLDKIFDRFYRVAKTRKLHQDGSGLGLAIAKWIVREHGGTLEVTSSPGVGTSFKVLLPVIH
ncbi:MAG: HAMP domain-containing histidine kinase [Firmicutes bacterium]|nr:HAMP domain-containing histidine kinase [Bacillota bacterium]